MRSAALPFAIVLFLTASAQKPLERTEVIRVDSVTPSRVLTSRSKIWIANAFKSANAVLQYEDSTRLIGKGRMVFNEYGDVTFTLEIESRSGRVRVRFYDVAEVSNGKTITVGDITTQPAGLGPIFDDPLCYTPVPVGFQSRTKATSVALKQCETTLPYVKGKFDELIRSLEHSLRSASLKEDW